MLLSQSDDVMYSMRIYSTRVLFECNVIIHHGKSNTNFQSFSNVKTSIFNQIFLQVFIIIVNILYTSSLLSNEHLYHGKLKA